MPRAEVARYAPHLKEVRSDTAAAVIAGVDLAPWESAALWQICLDRCR